MNNEPVAWYWEEKQIVDLKRGSGKLDKVFGTPIPLYTHPAKTLTDEEIKTIDKLVDLCWGFSVSGVYFHEFQENVETIEKVDAILKKASEK